MVNDQDRNEHRALKVEIAMGTARSWAKGRAGSQELQVFDCSSPV